MGRINNGNLTRFSSDDDDTLVTMRRNGHTFIVIGKVLKRRPSTCCKRFDILTNEITERRATKQVNDALRLNRQAKKKAKQLELYVIDSREPLWLAVMKGREYEDEPEYTDPDVMRADILAEQRHTTPYGF